MLLVAVVVGFVGVTFCHALGADPFSEWADDGENGNQVAALLLRAAPHNEDTGIFNLSRTSHPQLTFFVMGNWASSRLEHYWFSGTHSALAHSKKPKTDPLKILEVNIKNLAPRGPAYSPSDSNEPIFRENGQDLSSQEGFLSKVQKKKKKGRALCSAKSCKYSI
ncbi:hypothetical protein B0H11DRAFT_2204304 [Mycena galericulata]|nr:hypothetical protein B0H11DRAFT_2204304 [Mycena galericulata]